MAAIHYLNVPEALVVYAEIIRVSHVEAYEVQNLSGLESALAQPQQTFDGVDLYETLEDKAAALLYSLCQNHAFTDGNKRLAFAATRTFLRCNEKDLEVETYDVRDFMYSVARGEQSVEKVAVWIRPKICTYESLGVLAE